MSESGEPPEFLARERELWEAWRRIQAAGHGAAAGRFWRVWCIEGDPRMYLEITFRPTVDLRGPVSPEEASDGV